MRIVGMIMRFYSYLFHGLIGLAMMAVSSVSWLSGHPLRITFLPWQAGTLNAWLFFGGLAGILLALLAFKRIAPVLFVVWNLLIVGFLVWRFVFSPVQFGGTSIALSTALWLTGLALLALLCSLFEFRRGETRRRAALA